MAMVPFEDVRAYIRSEPEDDDQVRELISVAKSYLKNSGICEETADGPLYGQALKGIVLHLYDNRNATGSSDPSDFAIGTRLIINQLKREAEIQQVSNLDIC